MTGGEPAPARLSSLQGLSIPDGLSEIRHEMPRIMEMIARTARWVHPLTFSALPVWCPDTARGRPRYNAAWTEVLINGRGVPKVEENIRAATALVEALGVKTPPKPKNWTVCHIWGYDDENFTGRSKVVQDPRFYSCVGNMVWLPTPLKGFTDAVPEIKACLRVCAFHLYGWACEHDDVADAAERVRAGEIPDGYPESWPTPTRKLLPPGAAPFSARVQASIAKRKARIRQQLANPALAHFGHDSVEDVLRFWRVEL